MNPLYRYRRTGLSLANTIEEIKGKLWCSAPSKLNDPFDGIGYVKPEKANIEFDTTGDPILEKVSNPYIVPITLSSFVACFSGKWDNPPMWAHYSQFHGICLGYDHEKLSECVKKHDVLTLPQLGMGYQVNLDKVEYKKEFIISEDDNSPFVKTIDWDYEDEWRIVVKGSPDNIFGVIIDTHDCLTEITLGHEIDMPTTNTIIDTIKYLGRDIKLYQAKIISGKAGYFRDPLVN